MEPFRKQPAYERARVPAILLWIFTGYAKSTFGWDMIWILLILDSVYGVVGIGCLLMPNTFGVHVLRLIESMTEDY